MNFFKNKNIRLYLVFISITLLIFSLSSLYLISEKNKTFFKQQNAKIQKEIEQVANFLKVHNNTNRQKIVTSERIINTFLSDYNELDEIKKDTFTIAAIIENSAEIGQYTVTTLKHGSKKIYKNTQLLSKLRQITGAYISIYQKTTNGYVQIVSNFPNANKKDVYPIFIHNSSNIIQDIEKGIKHYTEKININKSSLEIYSPMYVNGFIKGIIHVSIDEAIPAMLNKILAGNNFYLNKEFFFVNSKGNSLLESEINELIKETTLFKKMKLSQKDYNIIENIKVIKGKKITDVIYYTYIPTTKSYFGIIKNKDDIYNSSSNLLQKIILISIISIILFSLTFIFLVSPLFKNLKYTAISIRNIRKGKFSETKNNNDETIKNELEKTANHFSTINTFIKKLTENKFDIEIETNSQEDEISQNLTKLKKRLINIINQQKQQDRDAEMRNKFTEGAARITNLLQHTSNLEKLSHELIKEIIDFLKVQQGAIFIINDEDPDNLMLEMKAHFSLNKERLADKKIPIKTGLTGKCLLEKASIYLTEIPKGYTKIKSGFGETSPYSLLLVPLVFNQQSQGVIEIASLNEIDNNKIQFLEDIGENIASTISNIRNTLKTEELLEQTQYQSDQIEIQRKELEERIDTHRQQNRRLDKKYLELEEITKSITSSVYLAEYDLTGKIVGVNNRLLSKLNWELEEYIDKGHKEVVINENYDKEYKNFWQDFKKGKIKELKEEYKSDEKNTTFKNIYIPIRNARGRIFRVFALGTEFIDYSKTE